MSGDHAAALSPRWCNRQHAVLHGDEDSVHTGDPVAVTQGSSGDTVHWVDPDTCREVAALTRSATSASLIASNTSSRAA